MVRATVALLDVAEARTANADQAKLLLSLAKEVSTVHGSCDGRKPPRAAHTCADERVDVSGLR